MSDRLAIQVVDLAYGDCGKGSVVDFIARRHPAAVVVRFNGGPQAGHNVVTPDRAQTHTFSQFGAGTFVPGVRTVLSRFMLIEPYALFNEADHLEDLGVPDVWARMMIDGRCPVISPAQQAANRLRELARGASAHGTCGMGVGETVQDTLDHPHLTLHAGELSDRAVVAAKLKALADLKAEQLRDAIALLRDHAPARFAIDTLTDRSWLDAALDNYSELNARAEIANEQEIGSAMRDAATLIFEGAQGVLLDEEFGFHPHTTWSNTTFRNADRLLDESGYEGRRYRLGVLRTYFTRHGAGPFVTEDKTISSRLPEAHNNGAGWQGQFRVGLFDAVAARYALAVAGPVDGLAITHLDRLPGISFRMCRAYQGDPLPGADADHFVVRGGRIVDIRVRHPADLSGQESLGQALGRCRPINTGPEGNDAEAFVSAIEQELCSRVVLTSAGPTAGDVEVRRPANYPMRLVTEIEAAGNANGETL